MKWLYVQTRSVYVPYTFLLHFGRISQTVIRSYTFRATLSRFCEVAVTSLSPSRHLSSNGTCYYVPIRSLYVPIRSVKRYNVIFDTITGSGDPTASMRSLTLMVPMFWGMLLVSRDLQGCGSHLRGHGSHVLGHASAPNGSAGMWFQSSGSWFPGVWGSFCFQRQPSP